MTAKHFESLGLENLIIISLNENRGPAFARNHGAGIASGNILFFLDSDVELLPDTISRLNAHFSTPNHQTALIGSYDNIPSEKALVSKYRNLLHHYTHQTAKENATTFWGACGAIEKNTFLSIGGFDDSFGKPSVEDIELGYRLCEKGQCIRLDKELQVKHLKKWSFWNMVRTDVLYRARPWTRLLKLYPKINANNLNISYNERLAVVMLLVGLSGLSLSIEFSFLLPMGLVSFTLLLLVKRKIYSFFTKHFEWYKVPAVILLHWIYLLCAFIGFVLGTIDHILSRKHRTKTLQTSNREGKLVLDE